MVNLVQNHLKNITMKLVNFHTHKPQFNSNSICVVPYDVDSFNLYSSSHYKTIGLHPWKTESSEISQWLGKLNELAKQPDFIGIGEIGLDRLKGAPLKNQIDIFEKILETANEFKKPIIIHCVRCWTELIAILSKSKYRELPKAIHGFRAKADVAKQLVDNGFYLSFGTALIHATPELAEALTLVPRNKLFLETDDTEIPIYEVYDAAADILDSTIEELVSVTNQNLLTFFGNTLSDKSK